MPILFGVATLENAFDQVAKVEVLVPEEVEARETELQKVAKQLLPKIHIDQIDVLVIDEIGKNISGDGMDPNITDRKSVVWGKSADLVGRGRHSETQNSIQR